MVKLFSLFTLYSFIASGDILNYSFPLFTSIHHRFITTIYIYHLYYLLLGGYPAYSGYPKTIVDWEIKKRESIIAVHKEMHGHAELIAQLR